MERAQPFGRSRPRTRVRAFKTLDVCSLYAPSGLRICLVVRPQPGIPIRRFCGWTRVVVREWVHYVLCARVRGQRKEPANEVLSAFPRFCIWIRVVTMLRLRSFGERGVERDGCRGRNSNSFLSSSVSTPLLNLDQ